MKCTEITIPCHSDLLSDSLRLCEYFQRLNNKSHIQRMQIESMLGKVLSQKNTVFHSFFHSLSKELYFTVKICTFYV